MKLQTKLFLSLGLIILVSGILLIALIGERFTALIIATEKNRFAQEAQAIKRDLEGIFIVYLKEKVNIVLRAKDLLKSETIDCRKDIMALEEAYPHSLERDQLVYNLLQNHNNPVLESKYTIPNRVFLVRTHELLCEGIHEIGLTPYLENTKRQNLGEVLQETGNEGSFSLWKLGKEKEQYVLIFIVPLKVGGNENNDDDRILVSRIFLNQLINLDRRLLDALLSSSRNRMFRADFYDKDCFILRDSQGKILVERGDKTPFQSSLDELFHNAPKKTETARIVMTEQGEYLCHFAWIQAFNWHLFMATPLKEISKPSTKLINLLALAGAVVLICTITITRKLLVQSLRPLETLRNCTNELSMLDLSSKENILAMKNLPLQQLDVNRTDEFGELSRSFATMGLKLADNILSTMDIMTKQKRLEGELTAARDIQMGILSDLSVENTDKEVLISAFLEPAREVGGDLYDYFVLNEEQRAIIIGDVSGKGVPAALFMTMGLTLIRYALRAGTPLEETICGINNLLEAHNPGSMFITLFAAIYTPKSGNIVYANCGHCPPLLIDREGHIRRLDKLSGSVVGAMSDLEYTAHEDTIREGEMCLIYTDGLSEAMNSRKELYGEERIIESMKANNSENPKDMHEAIFADVCRFRGTEPPSDDITMLAFYRTSKHS